QKCNSVALWNFVPRDDEGLDFRGSDAVVVDTHIDGGFSIVHVTRRIGQERPRVGFYKLHISVRHTLQRAAVDDCDDQGGEGDEENADGDADVQPAYAG